MWRASSTAKLTITTQGLLLGIGSGLFYSSYTIFGRLALKYYQPFTVTFYTFLIAGIGSLFMTNSGDLYTTFHSPQGILLSLGLMVCGTVLPRYILYTKGLNDLGDSGKASILASIEPVVASLVGIAAFGEPMTLGVVLGLVCILASVYILSVNIHGKTPERRENQRGPHPRGRRHPLHRL